METVSNNTITPKFNLRYLTFTLVLSLSLHIFVLKLITFPDPVENPTQQPIIVSLDFIPEPKQQKQIISPPNNQIESPPTQPTNLLSEKNLSTPKEQIKRGDLSKQSTASPPPSPSTNSTKTKSAVSKPEKLSSLRLKDPLQQESTKQNTQTQEPSNTTDTVLLKNFTQRKPFSNNELSASALNLYQGTPDYLPNLPDGDITLLNAKASRFAIFVRRVALQVFGALRKHHWEEIPPGYRFETQDFITIHATMSLSGKLLKVELKSSSGNNKFDHTVLLAVQDGAWDQNPPENAKSTDGNIHFIFQSRAWSRFAPGSQGEQRWILLGTGLL